MKKKKARRKSFKHGCMQFHNRIQSSKALKVFHDITTGVMIAIVLALLPGCDEIEEFAIDE